MASQWIRNSGIEGLDHSFEVAKSADQLRIIRHVRFKRATICSSAGAHKPGPSRCGKRDNQRTIILSPFVRRDDDEVSFINEGSVGVQYCGLYRPVDNSSPCDRFARKPSLS